MRERLPAAVWALFDTNARWTPTTAADHALWPSLQHVLRGEHLSQPQTQQALEQVLSARVNPALAAALLIGQRMNIEDAAESQGYALADAPQPVEVDVASLLHVGQPYNGSARSFRPALFAAAVLAELGIATDESEAQP